uniref:Uncharacterized protein n=1 Tax=Minutocellus polymorphus TaxID=265543 RepID=A0A7S0AZW8_9STRA
MSPALFKSYLKYADPLWTEEDLKEEAEELSRLKEEQASNPTATAATATTAEQLEAGREEEELVRLAAFASAASLSIGGEANEEEAVIPTAETEKEPKELLLDLLQRMRKVTEARLLKVESELQ